ncbi:hypothetical protein HD554DRAFT_2037843 [Boletus coccyginus]|nr:hypothetical protein HD554DRAFT_2037843 [Boletus coccyginus]
MARRAMVCDLCARGTLGLSVHSPVRRALLPEDQSQTMENHVQYRRRWVRRGGFGGAVSSLRKLSSGGYRYPTAVLPRPFRVPATNLKPYRGSWPNHEVARNGGGATPDRLVAMRVKRVGRGDGSCSAKPIYRSPQSLERSIVGSLFAIRKGFDKRHRLEFSPTYEPSQTEGEPIVRVMDLESNPVSAACIDHLGGSPTPVTCGARVTQASSVTEACNPFTVREGAVDAIRATRTRTRARESKQISLLCWALAWWGSTKLAILFSDPSEGLQLSHLMGFSIPSVYDKVICAHLIMPVHYRAVVFPDLTVRAPQSSTDTQVRLFYTTDEGMGQVFRMVPVIDGTVRSQLLSVRSKERRRPIDCRALAFRLRKKAKKDDASHPLIAPLTTALRSLSIWVYATGRACPNCNTDGCVNYWTCEGTAITCYYPSATDPGSYDGCVFTGELTEGGYYVGNLVVTLLNMEDQKVLPSRQWSLSLSTPCSPQGSTNEHVGILHPWLKRKGMVIIWKFPGMAHIQCAKKKAAMRMALRRS